jgi:hypothetical protein
MLEQLISQVCSTEETGCPEQYLPAHNASKALQDRLKMGYLRKRFNNEPESAEVVEVFDTLNAAVNLVVN